MHGVLDGKWKLIQTIDHARRTTEVETMLFDVYADPGEQVDLAAKYPEEVTRLVTLLDARLALHPVGGIYVQLSPHPGWRAPLDYADAVLPADKSHEAAYEGFGASASKGLQSRYGNKGRINYDQ